MLQDCKCSVEEEKEEGEEDRGANKMALCVRPHDPLTLCAPCVNSDLWIISFEDEMTWCNQSGNSKTYFQRFILFSPTIPEK